MISCNEPLYVQERRCSKLIVPPYNTFPTQEFNMEASAHVEYIASAKESKVRQVSFINTTP